MVCRTCKKVVRLVVSYESPKAGKVTSQCLSCFRESGQDVVVDIVRSAAERFIDEADKTIKRSL